MHPPHFTALQWALALLAALFIGLSKTGFNGMGMLALLLMAHLFSARESTGVILPLLVAGDVVGVTAFQRHAQWRYIGRLLPAALAGIAVGYWLMAVTPDRVFRPVIGGIVLTLSLLQLLRQGRPDAFRKVPHALWFGWAIGATGGVTTMLANAAGPIIGLYLLAVRLPKLEFVGTGAWFFLIVNVCKLPLSADLGLISPTSLALNLILLPAVIAGALAGRRLVHLIPQRSFEGVILALTMVAALRLCFV